MGKILITADYLQLGDSVDAMLVEAGHEVEYSPAGRRDPAQSGDLLVGFDAAIIASEPITAEMLDAADRLKIIARAGVGYDSVDVEAASAHHVVVTNTPGVNHQSVAEMVFSLMLTHARNLQAVLPAVQSGTWPREAGRELSGTTLGIIGFGASGQAVAQIAQAFGIKVLVESSHATSSAGIEVVSRKILLEKSDFISLHGAATDENKDMVNANFLAQMKDTAVLINTARGSLVDEVALAQALDDGTIAGAGLDVLKQEPVGADSPLLGKPNVLITSHLAGQTREARERTGVLAAEQVLAILEGQDAEHRVN